MPGKHHLDEKNVEKQSAAKRGRYAREKDQSLFVTFDSFLKTLNADDKSVTWDKKSVIEALHAKATFPTQSKNAAATFSAIQIFPANYAFAVYSQKTRYPIKLRAIMQGLDAAQRSKFSLHYFNLKIPQRNDYQAHVFYLRCADLTQSAQKLWAQLRGDQTADESKSTISTPSSRMSSLGITATAASAVSNENRGSNTGALTTAEIYARLQNAVSLANTALVDASTGTLPPPVDLLVRPSIAPNPFASGVAAAAGAALAAKEEGGVLLPPLPEADLSVRSASEESSVSLQLDDDKGELYPSGYVFAQAAKGFTAADEEAASSTLLTADSASAPPISPGVSPSHFQAGLFGRVSPPPITAPAYASPFSPKLGSSFADS